MTSSEIARSEAFCYRCGHLWAPKGEGEPRRCPRCHSSRWDVPERKLRRCKFCGVEFHMASLDEKCPGCGRLQTEGLTKRCLHCNQCDYDWYSRFPERPQTCPMCRSTQWDSPKVLKLMCSQCGHLWRSQSEHPKRCPHCRSTLWDRPVCAVRCQRCGHSWKMRAQRSEGVAIACPRCRSRSWNVPVSVTAGAAGGYILGTPSGENTTLIICSTCGSRWYSSPDDRTPCPSCGSPIGPREIINSSSMPLWSEGDLELCYVSSNGCGCVYLWERGVPVACMYIHEVLKEYGVKMTEVVESVNSDDGRFDWRPLAERMSESRDDYRKYIGYFKKRFSLSELDARILAIHFTGMSPKAIALMLSMDEAEISGSFERIMAAYSDSGIIVDDTIFMENPFSYY